MNPPGKPVPLQAIRDHYDRLSPLYHRFWGEHIHHGYWTDGESPKNAQERLTARLAELARIPRGARVLDIGSGLGGSSFWLAREYGCSVQGITLSPVQARTSTERAREQRLDDRVHFQVADANRLEVPPQGFDVVWIIECSEHLFDRADFFRRCAAALKPGGTLAVAAWLSDVHARANEALMRRLADAMLCPPLGRLEDYAGWMRDAGLVVEVAENVSRNVAKTWELATDAVNRFEVQMFLRFSDEATREFAAAVPLMHEAFQRGALGYGFFVARKPAGGARP